MLTGRELGSKVNIRPATAGDSDEILRWRNDDVTRAMSLNTEPISAEQHSAWFACLLSNERRLAFVGTVSGHAVGWVRFDPLENQDGFLVSITIAPEARSRGMGSQLLGQALRNLRSRHPKSDVVANVKKNNVASRRLFQNHLFRLSEDTGPLQTFVLREFGSGPRGSGDHD